MLFDYRSLLLAIAFSGAAMSMTLMTAWFSAKKDTFLLTWAAGMMVMVFAVIGFKFYDDTRIIAIGATAFFLLPAGCALVWAAARQFRTGQAEQRWLPVLCAALAAIVSLPFAQGFSGTGIIISNVAAGALLVIVAREYWIIRHEAPALIGGLCTLYVASGISFVL